MWRADGGGAIDTDVAATVVARDALRMSRPALSAATGLTRYQILIAAGTAVVLAAAGLASPQLLGAAAYAVFVAGFVCLIAVRAAAAAGLGRHAAVANRLETVPRYAVLAALHHEAEAVGPLVAALDRLDWPRDRLEGQLLVEADDRATIEALDRLALPRWLRVTRVAPMAPRTKPKALNVGLGRARADLIAVFDAEDRPEPDQLRRAAAAFAAGPANLACVQGALDVDRWDAASGWTGPQFALEYAIHFRLLLPAWAALGWPIPLGGTSNHFRAEALRACGGWDPYNVTEDADLGIRLTRDGWAIAILDSATREEAAPGLAAWLGQRSRWIKGHLQTWAVHMRDPVRLVREIGLWRALGLQVALLGALASAFLHLPLTVLAGAALIRGELDVGPLTLLSAGYLSALACAGVVIWRGQVALTPVQAAVALVTLPVYWPLQSVAAARAAFELWRDPHHWVKTPRCAGTTRANHDRGPSDHARRAGGLDRARGVWAVAQRTAGRSDAAADHSMDAGGSARDVRGGAGAGPPSESGGS